MSEWKPCWIAAGEVLFSGAFVGLILTDEVEP
jgi:hypothetical protein